MRCNNVSKGTRRLFVELKKSLTPFLSKVLASYGASKDEIDEILAKLWGDCLTGPRPLFHVFNGKSALKSWLTAISVNRWISLKRREAQHARAMQHLAIDSENSQAPEQIRAVGFVHYRNSWALRCAGRSLPAMSRS